MIGFSKKNPLNQMLSFELKLTVSSLDERVTEDFQTNGNSK